MSFVYKPCSLWQFGMRALMGRHQLKILQRLSPATSGCWLLLIHQQHVCAPLPPLRITSPTVWSVSTLTRSIALVSPHQVFILRDTLNTSVFRAWVAKRRWSESQNVCAWERVAKLTIGFGNLSLPPINMAYERFGLQKKMNSIIKRKKHLMGHLYVL